MAKGNGHVQHIPTYIGDFGLVLGPAIYLFEVWREQNKRAYFALCNLVVSSIVF